MGADAEDLRADHLRTLERFEQGQGLSLERAFDAGLERFLKSFPRSPVAPHVRARLEQVRAGTRDFRFHCQPG